MKSKRGTKYYCCLITALVLWLGAFLYTLPCSAVAATFSNACQNSITANSSQINVTMTAATTPDPVSPGGTITLSNIQQSLNVPGSIFVIGYNLGLLSTGVNNVPTSARTIIEGTNTVEATQATNFALGSISTTITDPDGIPGTGDETATDGQLSVTYNDQTWTAGASGTIEFREDTVTPLSTTLNLEQGGVVIRVTIAGFLGVRYACSPGTVTPPDPGIVTFTDPALPFASATIAGSNGTPIANAGPDQIVASGATVNLNGTGSDDPDGDALTYSWAQTSGPSVTLSGADTATPGFTAPTGSATLTFQLQVCDPSNACDTDTVVIAVGILTGTTFTNACRNSVVPTNWDQVDVTMSAGASPSPVMPGGAVTLSAITQTMSVPGSIFVAGYNLGLLNTGVNNVPATVHTLIDATNTIDGQQTTNFAMGTVSITISDPDGTPGTGDETSTDGSLSVTYANEIWTAGASGTIDFREHTDTGITSTMGGGIIAEVLFGSIINVQFHCSPGTVSGGTATFMDPAPTFASTIISPQCDSDTTPPVLSGCPAPSITVQCDSDVPPPATVTATDNCAGPLPVTFNEQISFNGTAKTITRTWTAEDQTGNTASCSQSITVRDTTPPLLSGCPSPIINVQCDSDIPPPATVTATDNCAGPLPVTFNEQISFNGTAKTITRTWTAEDQTGNTASCSQSITVRDTTPPVITCPADITVTSCTDAQTFAYTPDATDNCEIQSLVCTPPAGSTFPGGTTTVTCTATDPSENSASCVFDVEVFCPICRTAGFWGTHAGTECPKKKPNCGSQNITQAVIDDCDEPCLEICGEVITNTDRDSANSALEAICVSPLGDERLQLARQLTAASLNCCISAGEGDCEGLDVWEDLFTFCNSVCALNVSDSFSFCVDAMDCLNKGGNPIMVSEDPLKIFCQTGTCVPVVGDSISTLNDISIPCDENTVCLPEGIGNGYGIDQNGIVCVPLEEHCIHCAPFEETCHTRELCNEDLVLCFDENRPAGSSNECTTAIGDGKGKNADNSCAILPMPNPPATNCSRFNQGEECCDSDSESVCEECEHDLCETGLGLDLFCDPCVTAVCFEHPECCDDETGAWDSTCVSEAIAICDISCNEIGWANLQWPPTMTHTVSAINRTDNAYGQVWIDGMTNQSGPTPGLRAQLGFGSEGSNPAGNPGWTWVDASFNVDAGNNDEFVATMLPDTVGQFDYLYRYSTTNGLSWLYADLNGPVPSGGLPPNPGKLTVNSSGDTTAPNSPVNLIVVSVLKDSIELAWDAVMGDPTLYGYEVLRGTVSGGPYIIVALVSGTTNYIDMSVQTGETYFYVVRAVDLSFNRSGNSNEVQGTPQLRTVTVTFNVTVPSSTDATGRSVYIAGTLDQLNGNLPAWDPGGVVLTRLDATHWTIALTGNEETVIDYKYTLGDWEHVEKGGSCEEIGNRQLTLSYGGNGTQTVNDVVSNWRNVAPCGN